MDPTRRKVLHELNTDNGSIVQEMKSYSRMPVENDGLNIYGNTRINPITSAPFASNQEIEIPLTTQNFDVCEFSNTYIHMKARLRLSNTSLIELGGKDVAFNKLLQENQYLFVGLKSASHIIRDYQIKFNKVPITTTMQSSAIYESFLYSTFKSKSEIANKKFVFSPYNEVSVLDNSACGIYIPISDLNNTDATNTSKYHDVDIVIPLREILAMEAFNEFPNRIFGELRLVFHVSPEAFVYTEVNPITSIRKGIIMGKVARDTEHISSVLGIDPDTVNYQRSFEQVGIPSRVQYVSSWDTDNNKLTFATVNDYTPQISELTIVEAWVDVKGYRMQDQAVRELTSHFSQQPFTVCAQKVEVNQFPSGPEASGLRTSMNVRFNHATDINILHPTDSRQRTIFRNIMHDNYQVQIGNRRFPEQLCSTISPQFHEMQIQASDFDSIFEANDEYEHSLTDAMLVENTDGTISQLQPYTDNTSFVPLFQLEREGNGNELWFDGINSQNEKVEINSRPIYAGKADIYYQGGSTPSPLLCTCYDTYWIFRIVDGKPSAQYVTAHTYDEAFTDPSLESVNG